MATTEMLLKCAAVRLVGPHTLSSVAQSSAPSAAQNRRNTSQTNTQCVLASSIALLHYCKSLGQNISMLFLT